MAMKGRLLLVIIMSIHSVLSAQYRLEKIWETDTLTYTKPESVLYDTISKTLYVSCMGAGKVARLGTDGKLIKDAWVNGLTSNKGSAIFNGLFYTAETNTVAVIDIEKAAIIKRIPVEGAIMLNDLAIDARGIVYVTDTRAGKVYRIEGDKAVLYLENLPGANGLLPVQSDLYVVTSTTVEKVDAQKNIKRIAEGFEAGLDGIVMLADQAFILSNYKGILYLLKADGTREILSDTRSIGIMCNDISYDPHTKILFVPAYSTSQVFAYKLISK
jgi:SMP-30/Gluconolactonase/LRE-like region